MGTGCARRLRASAFGISLETDLLFASVISARSVPSQHDLQDSSIQESFITHLGTNFGEKSYRWNDTNVGGGLKDDRQQPQPSSSIASFGLAVGGRTSGAFNMGGPGRTGGGGGGGGAGWGPQHPTQTPPPPPLYLFPPPPPHPPPPPGGGGGSTRKSFPQDHDLVSASVVSDKIPPSQKSGTGEAHTLGRRASWPRSSGARQVGGFLLHQTAVQALREVKNNKMAGNIKSDGGCAVFYVSCASISRRVGCGQAASREP